LVVALVAEAVVMMDLVIVVVLFVFVAAMVMQ